MIPNEAVVAEIAREIASWRKSIRLFIRTKWHLEPQPIKPEYREKEAEIFALVGQEWEDRKHEVKASWYGDPVDTEKPWGSWVWYSPDGPITSREEFLKKKYYTWQQHLILVGVEKAMSKDAKSLLSIVSGHGLGKSTVLSWIILWFLYVIYESQVAATAPTAPQMSDVLWKELSKWINRLKDTCPEDDGFYMWTSEYVRVSIRPHEWFARARTATKENPEALAGVHSEEGVLVAADEASAIPQQIFDTAEGALTSANALLVMISNGTQGYGYFFDSHHNAKHMYQCFTFNGEESPMVDREYIVLKRRLGPKSDEYRIRVMGGFPSSASMDDSGYVMLVPRGKISVRLMSEVPFVGRRIMGVDPSGEGKDTCTFCIRDAFKAQIVHELLTTNDSEIAENVLTLADKFQVKPEDIVIGGFGVGSTVPQKVALATASMERPYEIYSVLEGTTPETEERNNPHFFQREDDEVTNPENRPDMFVDLYLNLRALMYFRMERWLCGGGSLVDTSIENSQFAHEISLQRYKRSLHGNKIQLVSKKELLKLGIKSPNKADALGLSFLRSLKSGKPVKKKYDDDDDEYGGGDMHIGNRFSVV